MAGAGSVIVFVCMFVLLVIVAFHTLAYAAYCYCVVMQATAVGSDEVVWPGEGVPTWLGRLALLGWLVLVWLVPVAMYFRANKISLADEPALIVMVAGVVLWLFFPVGLLSSLTGESRWAFFRPKLLGALVRLGMATLMFYVLTGVVIAVALAPWSVALTRAPLLVPVAAAIGAAAVLLHARLTGRLAWKLTQLTAPPPRPKAKEKPKVKKARRPRKPMAVASEDPRPAPPEAVSPAQSRPAGEEEVERYALAEEAPAPPAPPVPAREEEPTDSYGVEDLPPETVFDRPAHHLAGAPDLDARLARVVNPPSKPPQTFVEGIFPFLFYPRTRQPWVYLTIAGSLTGVVLAATVSLFPSG
jgi:hypothetical protein